MTKEPLNSVANEDVDGNFSGAIPIKSDAGYRISALNPKYLHTNSTSHTWPFSAIAELVDNAYDPDVKASQLYLDAPGYATNDTAPLTLTFTDNGNGMVPETMYKMLSFGFCEKVTVKGHMPVGHYGNGFKSGSMRLGKDALVFTKHAGGTRSLGFLSQTFLKAVGAETIIVPIVSWDRRTSDLLNKDDQKSLDAILRYSVINSREKIDKEFRNIKSETGTRIIIYNLRRPLNRQSEFDISSENFDIRIPDNDDPEESQYKREERQYHIPSSDFSLRAYLAILYLKPKMQIYLLGKKIKTVVITKSLSKTEIDMYKSTLYKKPIKITFGFSQNINHYGIMMYHRNRLIKPYVRVGYQTKPNNMGVGVVGVIECNGLQPTHNKQDFDYTQLYRATMNQLGTKLNEYWNEKCGYNTSPSNPSEVLGLPDDLWVQCDNPDCLKWRRLPDFIKKTDLPDKWYCILHPNPSWASCDIAEEEEEPDEIIKPYEKKRKKQQLRERRNSHIFQTVERERFIREEAVAEERRKQEHEIRHLQERLIQQRTLKTLQPQGSNLPQLQTTSTPSFPIPQSRVPVSPQTNSIQSGMVPRHMIPGMNNIPPAPSPAPISKPNCTEITSPVISSVVSLNQSYNSSQISVDEVKQESIIKPEIKKEVNKSDPRGTKKRPIVVDDDEEEAEASTPLKKPKVEAELFECESSQNKSAMERSSLGNSSQEEGDSDVASSNDQTIDKIKIAKPGKKSSSDKHTPKTCGATPSNGCNEPLLGQKIKQLFMLNSEALKNIDPDIMETLKKQSIVSLGMLLAKRSQALRVMKEKLFRFMKTIMPEADLDSYYSDDIDDDSMNKLLDRVLESEDLSED